MIIEKQEEWFSSWAGTESVCIHQAWSQQENHTRARYSSSFRHWRSQVHNIIKIEWSYQSILRRSLWSSLTFENIANTLLHLTPAFAAISSWNRELHDFTEWNPYWTQRIRPPAQYWVIDMRVSPCWMAALPCLSELEGIMIVDLEGNSTATSQSKRIRCLPSIWL